MIFLDEKVTVSWAPSNSKHYKSKGYEFTKCGDEFEVYVKDLIPTYLGKVKCQCDYCNKIFYKEFYKVKHMINNKVNCSDCVSLKRKETCLRKYGVENASCSNIVKEKMKKTCLEKYGCEYSLQRKDVREKIEKTCMEKYGVKNVFQNNELSKKRKESFEKNKDRINEKRKQTNIERYGVDCVLKNKDVQEKIGKTMLERYGVENISQNKEIKKETIKKINMSLYKNGTAPCSKQQEYLHNLLGGELNYAVDRCLLDIAFPKEMIYIEYDGGGHDLSVRLGHITREEFNKNEKNRQYFLKKLGWKLIRIICNNDKKINDSIDFINIINNCKNHLNNSSWIIIDLNDNIIYNNKIKEDLII